MSKTLEKFTAHFSNVASQHKVWSRRKEQKLKLNEPHEKKLAWKDHLQSQGLFFKESIRS